MKYENLHPQKTFTSYLDLLKHVYDTYEGSDEAKPDRTGVGRLSVYGACLNIDLNEEQVFPAETTRLINPYIGVAEMLWILKGDTNIKSLKAVGGGSIWDKWADEDGEIGPMYGAILNGHYELSDESQYHNNQDQLESFVHKLLTTPTSSRILMTTWIPHFIPVDEKLKPKENVALGYGVLAPCHGVVIQAFVHPNEKGEQTLSLSMYQRSADLPVGVVFNIMQYSFLVYLLCTITGYKPGKLMIRFGDAHIYSNQYEKVGEQIQRTPYEYPKITIDKELLECVTDVPMHLRSALFKEWLADDITAKELVSIENYQSHPRIDYPVAE